MYSAEIIKRVCSELIAADFRNGFEDSVTHRVRAAIAAEQGEEAACKYWSDFCCFVRRDTRKATQLLEIIDQEAIDLYLKADDLSRGPGAFKMPSWGTNGT